MNGLELLMNQFWVIHDREKEQYYQVKRELKDKQLMRFMQEVLGWRVIHTEQLIKLEKLPTHAESFMGIQQFLEARDYCLFCALLIFLEDKEENSQFLLSELIRYVETIMSEYLEVDWTSYSQRKSLVRVLQFAEEMGMLKTYEGDSSNYSNEQASEVLYENTGVSRYFATNFSRDITSVEDWNTFENDLVEESDHTTVNRVFRQLLLSPAMYWDDKNDNDAMYLKTKRMYIQSNLQKYMNLTLQVNHHTASAVYVDTQTIGNIHPKNGMLSEIVLLVCKMIHDDANDRRKFVIQENETIEVTRSRFCDLLLKIKKQYQSLWSKEYREMSNEKYIIQVMNYMKNWMMLKEEEEMIIVYPSCTLVGGKYTEYMEEKVNG